MLIRRFDRDLRSSSGTVPGITASGQGALLGLCLLLTLNGCGEKEPTSVAAPGAPNVIFIIADAMRADRSSLYGHDRETTPNLEILAKDGVVFDRAYAQAPWTPPSMGSWMTGLYQTSHGVTHSKRAEGAHSRLDSRHVTLAELFRSVGYRTAAVSAQPWISEATGFDQGFGTFEVVGNLSDPLANEKIFKGGMEWIAELEEGERFFLYLHSMDPHFPYEVPDVFRFDTSPPPAPFDDGITLQELEAFNDPSAPPSPEQLAHLFEIYDAEIRHVDSWLGALDRHLRKLGLREQTMIVFTSDHGEAFYEHGVWGHITTVYNEMLHIPLVLSWPGLEARRVDEPVESVDLLPTLARIVGFEPPPGLPGHDLLGDERPGLAYSEGDALLSFKIQSLEYSLIVDPRRKAGALFDLVQDPLEQRNVASQHPEETQRFARLLRDRRNAAARLALEGDSSVSLDEHTQEQLESLGYAR